MFGQRWYTGFATAIAYVILALGLVGAIVAFGSDAATTGFVLAFAGVSLSILVLLAVGMAEDLFSLRQQMGDLIAIVEGNTDDEDADEDDADEADSDERSAEGDTGDNPEDG